jgi:hypothetical protein
MLVAICETGQAIAKRTAQITSSWLVNRVFAEFASALLSGSLKNLAFDDFARIEEV